MIVGFAGGILQASKMVFVVCGLLSPVQLAGALQV